MIKMIIINYIINDIVEMINVKWEGNDLFRIETVNET